jgi:molecular chaperone GrpE
MSDEKEEETMDEQAAPVDKSAEYLAGWKRALADYDNLKKDLGRERGDMRLAAAADAVMRLVPVLDNFDAAMKHVPNAAGCGDPAYQGWVTGIGYIRTQLENALKEMGAEPYGKVGDAFDANLHDAVGERGQTDESPLLSKEGSGVVLPRIVELVARGWKIGDKIIRPAKVIVNK